jgi:predicted ABC-type transport system involved in lysophospholipase L1 biosynthesis ATPase subunit
MNIIRLEGITRNFQMGEELLKVLKGIDLSIERGNMSP